MFLFSEHPLQAYLDPGSGSMLVQVLLGGIAGVGVLCRLAWQRLRNRAWSSRDMPQPHSHDE